MEIVGIQPVQSLPALGSARSASAMPNAVESFQNLLSSALQNLQNSQAQTDLLVTKMAAGEPVDLHMVALAVEENSLTFQLALQVRNKLVEAYQEVTRMQI